MLRIAICDDAAAYGDWLAGFVEEWALGRRLNIQLRTFISGEELLADIEAKGYYDVVIMDIDLKDGMSGIYTAEKIKKIYEHICLIFISQYDDYYKEVFHIHPFQYLEKKGQIGRLAESLDQAVGTYRYTKEIYTFQFKAVNYSILLYEVLYFVSDKRVIKVCMEDGREYSFYGKLDEVEESLKESNSQFIRIHKSYLVNGRQMEMFYPRQVRLRNGQTLPVSPNKRGNLMHYHMEYLEALH